MISSNVIYRVFHLNMKTKNHDTIMHSKIEKSKVMRPITLLLKLCFICVKKVFLICNFYNVVEKSDLIINKLFPFLKLDCQFRKDYFLINIHNYLFCAKNKILSLFWLWRKWNVNAAVFPTRIRPISGVCCVVAIT